MQGEKSTPTTFSFGIKVTCLFLQACNHVWVTDHGVVCFYYNKPSGEVEGKVLVWLKPATCPLNKDNICSSSSVRTLLLTLNI